MSRGSAPPPVGAAGDGDVAFGDFARQVRAFLRRSWLLIGFLAILGGGLAGVAAVMTEDRYLSRLLLLVEEPPRSPIEAEQPIAATAESFVDGQRYILESKDVLLEVVRRERLTEAAEFQKQPPTWLEARIAEIKALLPLPEGDATPAAGERDIDPAEGHAMRTLREALSVSRRGDTNVVEVSVRANNPALAQRVAAAVGEVFVDNRERAQLARAERYSDWLDERALKLRRELGAAEDAVTAYRIENDLITGEAGTALGEQQLTELNSELISTRAVLAERSAAHDRARTVLEAGGDVQSLPEVQQSEIIDELRINLLGLQRRAAELRRGGVSAARLAPVEEELTAAQEQLDREVGRIVERLGNEVRTLEARERLISGALAEAGGQTSAASLASTELRELERRAEAARELYQRYLSNSGLAEEHTSFLSTGIEVIDPAERPVNPYYPPTKAFVLFGLVFGGGLGALLALLREAMVPSFMTARQTARVLGLPVLSCVPRLRRRETRGRFAFDLPLRAPMTAFSEAVRTARHELAAFSRSEEAPVVLITSAGPGEGKSSMAAALAASGQAGGLSVLLIDADLRCAGLTRMMQMQGAEGLSELVYCGIWDFHGISRRAGFVDVMPVGEPVESPSDLLREPELALYIEEARAHYDLIVIDGPPVANMVDAAILTGLADSVGLVVRWKHTPRDVVREALQRLDRGRVAGVILNAVNLAEVAQYGEIYETYMQDAGLPDGRAKGNALA